NDDLWSAKALLDAPDLVRRVHLDYFRAGADVAASATYQATFERLAERGLDHDAAEDLISLSVALAKDAAAEVAAERPGPPPIVAASIGPYGAYLADGSEYTGNYGLSVEELSRFHRERFEVLAGSGCDLLAIETIPSVVEIEALVTLLDAHPEMPAWVSFSCRDARNLCDGTPFADALDIARAAPSVIAAGFNCTDPVHASSLIEVAAQGSLPVVCYPNAGKGTRGPEGWTWNAHSPETFTDDALDWRRAGATVIGGCCGTTPADIAGFAGATRSRTPR
ncbi:MAG: homocysteine S-methyltransferase, partial [Actinomycetota bacterium]